MPPLFLWRIKMPKDVAFIINKAPTAQKLRHSLFASAWHYVPRAGGPPIKSEGMNVFIPAGAAVMIPFLVFCTQARRNEAFVRIPEEEFDVLMGIGAEPEAAEAEEPEDTTIEPNGETTIYLPQEKAGETIAILEPAIEPEAPRAEAAAIEVPMEPAPESPKPAAKKSAKKSGKRK